MNELLCRSAVKNKPNKENVAFFALLSVTQRDILYTSGSYETGSDDNSGGMGGREEEVVE